MWAELSKWAKDIKIFVSHRNANHCVISGEEEFNNQGDGMAHSVESQPISPAFLIIAQWAHALRGHSGKDRDFAWA